MILSLIAFSVQAAFATIHGPNQAHNPNIVVPTTSMPKWFDKPGAIHTHCLVWTGPAPHSSDDNPENIRPNLYGPLVASSPSGYHPSDIRTAYDVENLQGAQAIAIIDAYGYPTAVQDFNTFSAQFGLPQETSSTSTSSSNQVLQVVYAGGSQPPSDPSWALEQATDIEWVHAMAPNAKIYLIESADDSPANIFAAAALAATEPNVKEVSMSFGADEGSWEYQFQASLNQAGVVFFSSTGDQAGNIEFPSTFGGVVAVGGTSLNKGLSIRGGPPVFSEVGWSSEGGGTSSYTGQPSYQNFLYPYYFTRVVPDVVAVADPATGCAVYDAAYGGWVVIGGTSLSSPIVAGMVNDLGGYAGNSVVQLNLIYGSWLGSADVRDIVQGSTSTGLYAAKGWDPMTGVGSLLLSPVTLTLPNPGQIAATQSGKITYPFAAVDPAHPSRTIVSTMTGGPSWVTWDGVNLVANPPASTKTGSYPVGLAASEPGFSSANVVRTVLVRVAPPSLQSASLSNTSAVGGTTVQLTINMTNPAPAAGTVVGLVSSSSAVAVPGTVTLTQGKSSIVVPIVTKAVTRSTATTITVSYNGTKLVLALRLIP